MASALPRATLGARGLRGGAVVSGSTGRTDGQGLDRRGFVGALAAIGAAAVVGFAPLGRRWVSAAAPCVEGRFAVVPALDGSLHTDMATRASVSSDQGNISHHTPEAV